MSYTPTIWENGKKPAINATHLNKIEKELERLDNIVSVPDITETTETTMPNSYDGRLLVEEIGGGESEQFTTTGAQLFDIDTYHIVKGLYINGSDGTNATNGAYDCTQYIPCDKWQGMTLTLNKRPGGHYPGLAFYSEESATSFISGAINNGGTAGNPITFTVPATAMYMRFTVPAGSTEIMLNEGTEALPHEPYTGGIPSPNPSYPQEIKKTVVSEIKTHRKNFLKNTIESKTQGGVTFTVDDEGIITANGTATGNVVLYFDNMANKLEVGKTYVTSGVKSTQIMYADGTYDYRGTFTFSENMVEVKPYIQITNGQTVTNAKYYPMVRDRDNSDDTYEPYTESVITLSQPIDLYNKGGVQDVITPKQIKRKFASVVFDGSDDEDLRQDSTYMFRIPLTQKGVAYGENQLCTRLKRGASYSAIQKAENTFGVSGVALILHIEGVTSIDELRAWLVEHPMTVVYELAEEVTEELPLADQIALNSLSTHDGITYLEFDSEIEPTFKGEYGTSKVGGYTLEALLTARSK